MGNTVKLKWFRLITSIAFSIGLYFFYFKYVPQLDLFQIILVPILFSILILTAIKLRWGILLFVFVFPLINSLPYFFGIYEHIPHAPTALVLFLFFFIGWLIHISFYNSKISFSHPVNKPLALLTLMILFSGIITALRFANFFPFQTDAIYELTTNVNGVTSGGAIMSTLFHCLNYLTGFAFLFMLLNSIKTKEFIKKIIICLMLSLSVSLLVGLFQYFRNISFGNTPFWTNLSQINSTFKDPNAFGTFLAIVMPVVISMIFISKGWFKIFPILLTVLTLYLFPHVGNRSSMLGLIIAIVVFFLLLFKTKLSQKKPNLRLLKKPLYLGIIFICIIAAIFGGYKSLKNSQLIKRSKIVSTVFATKGSLVAISPERYFLWKEAWHMAKNYPFSGIGMGAYIIELPNYYSQDSAAYKHNLEAFRRNDSAENYFLHVLAELGWVGLLLTLWLFWVIISKLIKIYKSYTPDNQYKVLLMGIYAALFAFMVNIFFHTYVGSFETKYVFWLLVAVSFSFEKSSETIKKAKPKNITLVCGLILILLFSSVHLWNSTHSLSLKSRTERLELKQHFGLYQSEKTPDAKEFRWTKNVAGMTVEIKKPVISILIHAAHPDIRESPVIVKIFIIKDFFKSKELLSEVIIDNNIWKTYEYEVPAEVGKEVILLIKVSRTWNPLKTTGTPDPRDLGVAIGKIEFKDKSGPND